MAQKTWEISGGGDALRARRDSQRPPTRRPPAHAAGLTRGAAVIAPSGEQIEIAAGDQQAVVVEVGGGTPLILRRRPGARRRIRGRRDELFGPGAGPDPVAEPAARWQLRVQRAPPPTPAERAATPQRDPQPRPLGCLDRLRPRAAPRRDGAHPLSATGLPLFPQAQHRICIVGPRAPGADDGHERRHRPVSLRERRSSVPDRRDRNRRSSDVARARAKRPAVQRARPSGRHGNRAEHGIRFPAAEADRLDDTRPRVHRPRSGTRMASLASSSEIRTTEQGSRSGSTGATPT